MRDDFRFAWRMPTRFKLYAVAAVTTLALGIGTATGVFSVIDATLSGRCHLANPSVW